MTSTSQSASRKTSATTSHESTRMFGPCLREVLSTVLNPLPPAPQLDLFNTSHRDVERVSVRRANGVYYTPPFLTKYLARKCIKAFHDRVGADALPRGVDFACGSG